MGDPVNASDPTGAVIDIDGNGKLDGWDSAMEASRHTKDPVRKAYFKARAKVDYYGARGDVQEAAAAERVKQEGEWYNDLNISLPIGGWPLTGGVMTEKSGAFPSIKKSARRPYVGVGQGAPVSGSYMRGDGAVVPGVYVEVVVGCAYGVAGGFYWTWDEMASEQLNPPHFYWQEGVTSPNLGASVFVVPNIDLEGWLR